MKISEKLGDALRKVYIILSIFGRRKAVPSSIILEYMQHILCIGDINEQERPFFINLSNSQKSHPNKN